MNQPVASVDLSIPTAETRLGWIHLLGGRMTSLYDELQREERLHDRGKCVDGCIYCKKQRPILQSNQPGPESVQITAVNSEDRIEEAISVILNCWDEWDAEAQQEAQQAQSPAGWLDVMEEQLRVVLQGMVFDQDKAGKPV